jgi:hypothetical protein
MTRKHNLQQRGAINALLIATIGLSVVTVGLVILSVWAIMNYNNQKDTVDSQVSTAVATAKKTQADSDETKFNERDKEPNRQFVGPDDYGRLTFNYPKTWSVYISSDVTSDGGTYQAYLNPVSVPPIGNGQLFALRVTIEEQDYSSIISNYASLVKSGKLSSSSVTADGITGTRLDGAFSDDLRGSAVIFKIRDKTATIRTDANTFEPDFNAIVASIKFNE